MSRWDQILSLPVQSPPTLEFSAFDITWHRIEGYRGSKDRLARIPFSRVSDFLRGECNNKDCPTKFHVEASRRQPPESSNQLKVDGVLEYTLYWCSFGPDDHRKGGSVRRSRIYAAKRKSPAGRPSMKRGCVCRFIVKRLVAEPTVALVIYNHDKHVDKNNLPCHGPMDRQAAGTRAMFAPYISDELRLQVVSLLYVGVPVEAIYQRHIEMVEKQGEPSSRDDLLTHRCVRRIERKIRRATYELDDDDDASVTLWVENHQDCIFFYEDFSDGGSFCLGIQTEWQLQQMVRYGNCRLLASNSKFGTNKLKYSIHSVLVFDLNNTAIPVAWIVTSKFANANTYRWLRALYDRVCSKDPTWQLGGYVIDDPSADVRLIREVLQCSVLLSFWRARHLWHKKLLEKCPELQKRVMMAKRLGEAVSSACKENGDIELFKAIMDDFVDCSDFTNYFKATWFLRLGPWISSLKEIPVATAELSANIESYHYQLKLRLLNEKDLSVYWRADWLIDKLATQVHSFYWLDNYSNRGSFSRYWKDEWEVSANPWREAMKIGDSDITVETNCVRLVCLDDREKQHVVFNPGSMFALCDCNWSKMGFICKHTVKAAIFCHRQKMAEPSVGFFAYNKALLRILNCTSQDSVIRDHVVSLAVRAREQINATRVPSVHSVLLQMQKNKSQRSLITDFPSDASKTVPCSVDHIMPSETVGVSFNECNIAQVTAAVGAIGTDHDVLLPTDASRDGLRQCSGVCQDSRFPDRKEVVLGEKDSVQGLTFTNEGVAMDVD